MKNDSNKSFTDIHMLRSAFKYDFFIYLLYGIFNYCTVEYNSLIYSLHGIFNCFTVECKSSHIWISYIVISLIHRHIWYMQVKIGILSYIFYLSHHFPFKVCLINVLSAHTFQLQTFHVLLSLSLFFIITLFSVIQTFLLVCQYHSLSLKP